MRTRGILADTRGSAHTAVHVTVADSDSDVHVVRPNGSDHRSHRRITMGEDDGRLQSPGEPSDHVTRIRSAVDVRSATRRGDTRSTVHRGDARRSIAHDRRIPRNVRKRPGIDRQNHRGPDDGMAVTETDHTSLITPIIAHRIIARHAGRHSPAFIPTERFNDSGISTGGRSDTGRSLLDSHRARSGALRIVENIVASSFSFSVSLRSS